MMYPMIYSNPRCHCIEHDSKTHASLSYLCLRKSACRVLFLHSMIIVVVVAIVAFVVLILAVVP
jgi:hypothetical protein